MRHCYVLRVFTRGENGGNQLGVITDTTSLTEQGMQEIAAELGFSETVFLEWKEGEIPHARIFTPTTEMPFAGHPLVGAAWVLHALGPGGPEAVTCQIGRIDISFDGTAAWIDAPLGQPVSTIENLDAIGLGLRSARSAVVVEMPLRYVLVELERAQEVASFRPNPAVLSAHPDGAHTYVWARAGDGRVRARFFAPGSGVFEDPATGSAAVALARALQTFGEKTGSLLIRQGEEMGNPSDIHLSWTQEGARVGGSVVRDEVRELDV